MAIKAVFKSGEKAVTVPGLYQWDYGQVLEIESVELPAANVEVHFSCDNMNEAIVRNCSVDNGVTCAVIPDSCLEQSTPIKAWVYVIDGTQGHTALVVTLPIYARKRPNISVAPKQEYTDKYVEAVTEINKAVEALKNGDVIAEYARNAISAQSAATAGNASSANFAQTATTAEKDKEGNKLVDAYHLNPVNSGLKYKKDEAVVIDDLCKPSQCGVYTINWETVNGYDVTTLPADIPEGKGAIRLIVEADYNTDENPTVFQTLKMRGLNAEIGKKILMWTRQYNGTAWTAWQRFVSANELTTGELKPERSLNADNADTAKRADVATAATFMHFESRNSAFLAGDGNGKIAPDTTCSWVTEEYGLYVVVLNERSTMGFINKTGNSTIYMGDYNVKIDKTAGSITLVNSEFDTAPQASGLQGSFIYFYKVGEFAD